MSPEWLFRHRNPILVGTLLILVYCNLYGWLYVPFVAFEFGWRPDHQLFVSHIDPDSIAAPILQQDDRILMIDGRIVHRSATFFPPTATKTEYELTILRDDELVTATVPYLGQPDPYAFQLRLAAGVLSLVCWLVGAIVLRYSWLAHHQAIWLGYIFILMSVVVVSWNATLLGVPLAWITAQPLIFLLAASLVYLGMLPYYKPLTRATRRFLRALFTLAGVMGTVAFVEGAFLFPNGTSIDSLVGVSIYELSAAILGISGLSIFVVLVFRRLFAAPGYLQQQLRLLLVFVGIGFLPAVFLSFLPLAFWNNIILPMPIAIIAIIFVPVGYVYVIFRHTYLNLDGTVGRALPYLLLVLILTSVYALLLRWFDARFNEAYSLLLPAILLFLLIAAIAPAASDWINGWLRNVIFGRTLATQSIVRAYTQDLAHRPDTETLDQVITNICRLLNIKQSTLLMKNGGLLLYSAVAVGNVSEKRTLPAELLVETTLLRAVQQRADKQHPIFDAYPWAEIVLPIRAREHLLGLWLLGRPSDGYFHQESISFLEHAAGTLAMGSEIIFLLDSAEKLSRRILAIRDDERRTFATKLHDNPLQQISFIRYSLGALRRDETTDDSMRDDLDNLAAHLGGLETEMRELFEMAYPTHIDFGIEATISNLLKKLEKTDLIIEYLPENLDAVDDVIDPNVTHAVDSILREAFNNILKHSQATSVEIEASCYDDQLVVTVTDNGTTPISASFSLSELLREGHYGIVGMMSTAKRVGGSLAISPVQNGTQVRFQTPLIAS